MRNVLSAAALLSLGYGVPALAAPTMQPTRAVWGCVDPRATTALAIPDGRLRNRKWVEYVHRTGHCALLPAGRPFDVLARQGSLVLLGTPGAGDDTPPVYAQSADLAEAAAPPPEPATAPAVAVPTPATTPAPDQSAAPPPAVSSPAAPPAAADQTTASAAAPPSSPPDQASVAVVPPAAVQAPPAAAAPPAAIPPATTAPVTPVAPAPIEAAPVVVPPPATPAPAPENAAPVTAPLGTPAPSPAPVATHSSGVSLLLVLVLLALLGLVGAAVAIARQQRRFAHVEDENWPPRDAQADPLSSPSPVSPALHPEPSPQGFRRACVETLEQGGWTFQPSFAAGAGREGAPDILGRRRDAVLAVRCMGGNATITPEIIDEAAAMGQQARAHVTVLATAAPMTRRAHDEAMRLHVHVLAQDELGSLSA